MIFTPLQSNNNKKSRNNCFCSANNNLIFVMVSILFVGRYARWVATRTGTVRLLDGEAGPMRWDWMKQHFNGPLDFATSTYSKLPLLHFRRARRRIRKSRLIGDTSFRRRTGESSSCFWGSSRDPSQCSGMKRQT
jgi:hypothetical protein